MFRGRVDLTSGIIDTNNIPNGYNLMNMGGFIESDTLSKCLLASGIFGRNGQTNEQRMHAYGDGRYIVYIRRPHSNPDHLMTYLFDNCDSYTLIGEDFREAWISCAESFVILLKGDAHDTWLYDIHSGRLHRAVATDRIPLFYRGLVDLPQSAQDIASIAMGRHCSQRTFNSYPEHEQF